MALLTHHMGIQTSIQTPQGKDVSMRGHRNQPFPGLFDQVHSSPSNAK